MNLLLTGRTGIAVTILALVCLLCTGPASLRAEEKYVLKFATLAPTGTTIMSLLEEWAQAVETRSKGRLSFKFYPGGIQGDETDVLRKMRFGTLHGGAFSGYGIGHIYSPARVLELPFLFNNHAEIDYVRDHFMADFEQGYRENGYELLGWMEIGFVYFFSRDPITTFDDLKKKRIWLWQGDPLGQAFFDASGITPVPLSIIDVFTSLSTGLIDTVYTTPLAAIALQWFTKTSYVTNLPMANAIGSLVVTRKFYQKLPQDLQKLLLSTGRETGRRLIVAARIDNAKSIEVLRSRGLQFVLDPAEVDAAELSSLRDEAAAKLMSSGYIPGDILNRAVHLLESFRAGMPVPPPPRMP